MRRTLLAIGIAVLVSMLLAPHGSKYGVEGFGPFWSLTGLARCGPGGPLPIWWRDIGRVMIDMLALETVFLGVLFAVLANIRRRPKKNLRNEKKPTPVNVTRDKVIQALKPGGFTNADGSIGWSPNDHILDIELDGDTINVRYETKDGRKYHVQSFVGPVKVIQQTPIGSPNGEAEAQARTAYR